MGFSHLVSMLGGFGMDVAIGNDPIMAARKRIGPGDPREELGEKGARIGKISAHAAGPPASVHASWIASISNRW